MTRRACAFLVHPLTPAQRRLLGVRLADRDLLRGRPSDRVAEIARLDVATRRGEVRVHVVAVPDLPDALVASQQRALDLQLAAARIAERAGARVIGLGSALAVVAGRGSALADRTPLPVTTGQAATAWTCAALTRLVAADVPIGILGFAGTVGEAVAAALASTHRVHVDATTPAAVRRAHALGARVGTPDEVLASSAVLVAARPTGPSLDPRALPAGVTVIDLANPPTLAPGPRPPGVVELAGETLGWPGAVRGGTWGGLWRFFAGYEHGSAYACLAEPIAAAALGTSGWSGGRRLTPEAVSACGEALGSLGFTPRLLARRPAT